MRPTIHGHHVERGRGVKFLGVFDLDRLSSLTTRRREIGKVNVRETLGN